MLAIRMTRHGTKKRPFFHIVVADSRSPRDGRFIEKLGTYNPLLPREHAQRITLDKERIAHWLKVGAQPSDRVAKFLSPGRADEAARAPRADQEDPAPRQGAGAHEGRHAAAAPPAEAPRRPRRADGRLMSKDRVLLGVVAAPHGVRGLVRIKSFTEDPMAVAAYGPLSDETGKKEYRVEALSAARGAVLARIEGVADRTAAEALRGLRLYVERSALPATGEREWYEADLIGLAAVGTDGRDWGKVIAFHDFGAGSVMEVSGGGVRSVMLPFTDEAVPEIDVEGGKVMVDPPAGLLAGGRARRRRETDVWRAM